MHKPCAEPGCVTLAVFNQPGAGHGLYCGQHKPTGYVNVKVILAVYAEACIRNVQLHPSEVQKTGHRSWSQ